MPTRIISMFTTPLRVQWEYTSIQRKIVYVLILCVGVPTSVLVTAATLQYARVNPERIQYGLLWWCGIHGIVYLCIHIGYTVLYNAIIEPVTTLKVVTSSLTPEHLTLPDKTMSLFQQNDEFGALAHTLYDALETIQQSVHTTQYQESLISMMYSIVLTVARQEMCCDEQGILSKILYDIREIIQYDTATICTYMHQTDTNIHPPHQYDDQQETLRMMVRVGESTSSCTGLCLDMNTQCAAEQVLQDSPPSTVFLQYPTLHCYAESGYSPASWLGVPLYIYHQKIGIIFLEHSTYTYTQQDITTLETLASQITVAISHIRYIENMHNINNILTQERSMFTEGSVVILKLHHNTHLTIDYASPNVEHILGYSSESFAHVSFNYHDILYEEDCDTFYQEIEDAIHHPQQQYIQHSPYRVYTKTHDIRWLHDFTTIIRDDDKVPIFFLGYVIDITQQKDNEMLLLRLKKAIETVSVGVTITDTHGTIIYTNPAEAVMHGYRGPHDLIGKPANMLGDPSIRQHTPHTVYTYGDKDETFIRESRNIQVNGTVFPVYLISSKLYNEHGEYIGSITVSENISERKQAEYLLRRKNEEVETMAQTLAHDLMNPARGLEGLSEVLLEDYSQKLGQDGQKICHLINQYAQRMARMIEASRRHARTAESLDIAPISSLTPIRWAIDQLQCILKDVQVTVPCNSFVIQADVVELGRVFQNLLENAVKFSKPLETSVITIEQIPHRSVLEYRVRDNGIGINTQYQKKIFTIFHQVDPKKQQSHDGIGAGLAIVKKIVEKHGGTVRVFSEGEGMGTLFSFTIPLTSAYTPPLPEKTTQR